MTQTQDLVVRLKVNPSKLIRAMHDVGTVMRNMTADIAGKPRPPRVPYPKQHSGMTARQYRAARRAYAREKRAHKRALQTWSPDRAPLAVALRSLANAMQPKRSDFALAPTRQEPQ